MNTQPAALEPREARKTQPAFGSEIVWFLRTLPQRLGSAGLFGVALLIASVATWSLYIAPGNESHRKAQHFVELRQVTVLEEIQKLPPMQPQVRDPQEDLFGESEFQTAIERFIELAQKHSLTLMQGAYKVDPDRDTRLQLAVLNFPAQGSYVALRAFLEDVHTLRGVRLQSLQINRVAGSETDVNAQIQFAMLLHK